jgi:membrane-associated PAP2 superfamily phosphatase
MLHDSRIVAIPASFDLPWHLSKFSRKYLHLSLLNSASINAKLAHCFGAKKFWNYEPLSIAFPE